MTEYVPLANQVRHWFRPGNEGIGNAAVQGQYSGTPIGQIQIRRPRGELVIRQSASSRTNNSPILQTCPFVCFESQSYYMNRLTLQNRYRGTVCMNIWKKGTRDRSWTCF